MIDAVDVGNEVRKQYVPKHNQMPEARENDEILHAEDHDMKTAVSPENTPSTTKPELGLECKREPE